MGLSAVPMGSNASGDLASSAERARRVLTGQIASRFLGRSA